MTETDVTRTDSTAPDSTAPDSTAPDSTATQPRLPAPGWLVPTLALFAVVGWGFVQAVMGLINPALDPLPVPLSRTDFTEGRTTGALEKKLDRNLPARPSLIAGANAARYLLTRGAGNGVRLGSDGWLFLADELEYHRDGEANLRARADLLAGANRALAADGVKLVVALVPDKARVYESQLPGGHLPDYARGRYGAMLAALRARGVAAVDLASPLAAAARSGQVYYRTDTHWNQAGAKVAAGAIARQVRALVPDLPPDTFQTRPVAPEAARPGDLLKLMGLLEVPDWARPAADREARLETTKTSASAGGLLGDATVPVALVGTSYSLRGNFHGFLEQALGASVLNAAQDGAGFLKSATDYLADGAYTSTPPQVLIWEVPERFFQAPLDGESAWLAKVGLAP